MGCPGTDSPDAIAPPKENDSMVRRGWPREAARHSLAARGVETKRKGKPGESHSIPIVAQNAPKESLDEVYRYVCGQLEQTASKEAPLEEGAVGLLTDTKWVEANAEKLLRDFEIDEESKVRLITKIHRKYESEGK